LTTVAFAWTQPICNPNTGEVLQPSHFADEAAYFKYLKDHPGSYEMQAGGKCAAPAAQQPAAQQQQPVLAAANLPVTTTDTLSAPAKPAGTVICVVNVNDLGTSVEQRRVVDVTRFLSTHAGSFIMAAGKDCGATFTPNLPTATKQTNTANTLVTSPSSTSVGDTAASAPTFAAVPVDVAGVTAEAAPLEVAAVAVAGMALSNELAGPAPCAETTSLDTMSPEVAGMPGACGGLAGAELDLAGELQIVPSIPPFAGDGTTADEIVP
jgi:hypothetical protein